MPWKKCCKQVMGPKDSYRGVASATGSAGTIASGDYMKQLFPASKIVASEALQCPTLLENGFGAHRIEGIGDKHVPWIHNVKNTDMVVAIDDNAVVNLARLFNEPAGQRLPGEEGRAGGAWSTSLDLLGFSGIANVLSAIKFAKYYELGEHDVVLTVLTELDGAVRQPPEGNARRNSASTPRSTPPQTSPATCMGSRTDNMAELTYADRTRVHNLKYFTWVEQQGKTYEEIQAQWYDPDYWTDVQEQVAEIDALIEEFNAEVGL